MNSTESGETRHIVLRASDQDRDKVARLLRKHFSDGRLTLEEYEARIDQAYTGRTLEDLENLTRDLPEPRSQGRIRPRGYNHPRNLNPQVLAYLLTMLLLVTIWAVTGFGYFWPIWPMLGWGIGIARHMRGTAHHHHQRQVPPIMRG